MPGQSFSRDKQEHALSRAVEVGDAIAADEAGVQLSTLQRWRRRAEKRSESDGVSGEVMAAPESVLSDFVEDEDVGEGLDERERLERTARAFSRTADRARRRLDEIIPQSRSVQQLGIVLGIGTDKAAMVKRLLEEEDEREVRLSEDQAQLVAEVLRMFVQALGLPVTDAGRGVIRGLLGRAAAGDVLLADPADAEEAQAEVFAHFERLVLRRLEEGRKQLPAGPEEVEEVAEGVAFEDGVLKDEEIADAEVVEPELSLEERAKQMAARICEKLNAQAVEEQGFGVGSLESRAGGFDMPRGGF